MLDEKKSLEMLEGFQNHFNYDTTYMQTMLKENVNAYATFEAFLPMASFKEVTASDVIFVVKLTSMKNEDCGACLQLNVDMAVEAGVDKEIIKEVVFNEGKNLSKQLKEVYDFTLAVSNNENIDSKIYDKMNEQYSKAVMTEIALAIASTKVFPAIKKVLNDFHSCSVIEIKV